MKQGLLVIDMQNGVFTLPKPVYRKEELIANVRKAIRFARTNGISVIFSLHENDSFLQQGTAGHALIAQLSALEGDTVIRKTRPDIFADLEFETMLRERGIASLLVAGLISNGCVKRACLSALEKGFSVTLLQDAHSTFYANADKLIESVNRDMENAGARAVPVDEL